MIHLLSVACGRQTFEGGGRGSIQAAPPRRLIAVDSTLRRIRASAKRHRRHSDERHSGSMEGKRNTPSNRGVSRCD
jgi:hypothetical protein